MTKRNYKGIILAGGTGSRLHPITIGTSKHLLPIYNKPMIYYPLSVLMLANIKEILIITTPYHLESYKELLGDGSQFGISIQFLTQSNANGIAEAFTIGENFIEESNVALILGDNLFYGQDFVPKLLNASSNKAGCTLFAYQVKKPQDFGVIEIDQNNKPVSIEEKPIKPKSNFAITGLYFFDNKVISYAKEVGLSSRGEKEITDIINIYLQKNNVNVEMLSRGFAWLDTGTYDSLQEAGKFVQTIENRQGLMIACLEEIAFYKEWITSEDLYNQGLKQSQTQYGKYLMKISNKKNS